MSLRMLTIAAAGLMLLAADAPDKASKKDLDKMQGVWKVKSIQKNGKDIAAELIGNALLTIEGGKYTLNKDGKPMDEGTFTLDAGKKPATIDIQIGKDGPKKVGIYQIDGDTFTEALVPEGSDRPTELASKEGSPTVLIVFQREKK
jgi:uncharacterized protein (TIGR03067 family)